jgi:hypothetical protein
MERVKLDPAGLERNAGQKPIEADKGVAWLYIHDPHLQNYQLSSETSLTLTSSTVRLSESWGSPTFVGQRQRVLSGRSTATLLDKGINDAKDLQAGLALYKDEHRYVRLFFNAADNTVAWEHVNKAKKINSTGHEKLQGHISGSITLSFDYTEEDYNLTYDVGSGPVSLAKIDTLGMSGPDFVGPIIGVFATCEKEGGVQAAFDSISIE